MEVLTSEEKKKKDLDNKNAQNKEAIGIQFDYSNLISQSSNESRALKSMIDRIPDGKEILKHPLVEAFIMMKWYKVFWFWIGWMALKIAFISLFVLFGFEVLSYTELTKGNCSKIVTTAECRP